MNLVIGVYDLIPELVEFRILSGWQIQISEWTEYVSQQSILSRRERDLKLIVDFHIRIIHENAAHSNLLVTVWRLDSGRFFCMGTYSITADDSEMSDNGLVCFSVNRTTWPFSQGSAISYCRWCPRLIKRIQRFPFLVHHKIMWCWGLGNPLGVCKWPLQVDSTQCQNGRWRNCHPHHPTLHDHGECPI